MDEEISTNAAAILDAAAKAGYDAHRAWHLAEHGNALEAEWSELRQRSKDHWAVVTEAVFAVFAEGLEALFVKAKQDQEAKDVQD